MFSFNITILKLLHMIKQACYVIRQELQFEIEINRSNEASTVALIPDLYHII